MPQVHRLLGDDRRDARRAGRLADCAPDEALDRHVRLAARLLRASGAGLALTDGPRLILMSGTGPLEPSPARRVVLGMTIPAGQVVSAAAPVASEDARQDPRLRDLEIVQARSIAGYLGVPVFLRSGELAGSLSVVDVQPRRWSPDEISLLEELAHSLSAELELRLQQERAERHGRDADELRSAYEQLVENASNGIWFLDADGCTAYVNPRVRELLGCAEQELYGRSMLEFVSRDERSELERRLEQCRRGEQFRCELHLLRGDGAPLAVEYAAYPLYRGDRRLHGVFGVLRNVTEQRRLEEALRERSALLRAVTESATDAVFLKDHQGCYLMINSAGAAFLGLAAAQIVGRRDAELMPPESARAVEDEDRWVMERGVSRTTETELQVGGVTRTFLNTKDPYRDRNGRIIGVVGIARDMSERKQAEEALRRSEERYRTIFQASAIGICIVDLEGRAEEVNDAWARMLGYAPGELLGQLFLDWTHPEDLHVDQRLFRELASGARSGYQMEARLVGRDGGLAWGHLTATLVRDANGRPRGVIRTMADITERKSFEAALCRSEDQVRHMQKIEALGRLAGGIAHDMNNMLAVVNGYSSLLESLPAARPVLGPLHEIRRAGERAAALTRQLLAFSRKQVLDPRVLDLNEVVDSTQKMLRRVIGAHIELEMHADPDLGTVRVDPGQFEQVLVNLVLNARDAMPGGGRLTIVTANEEVDELAAARSGVPAGRYVTVAVSDTGCGIDEEILPHVFEPFFTTKPAGEGTGLGLSTVHGIVHQSGGHITVESARGEGAVFRIYLPRMDEPCVHAPKESPAPEIARGAGVVLLCEDEPMVRGMVRAQLELVGYAVLEAGGAAEALRVAAEHSGPIHVLLTDLSMPGGMNGYELARRLAQTRPETRVLVMSAYAEDPAGADNALRWPASFIQKPFSPSDLALKLRELLSGEPGAGGAE